MRDFTVPSLMRRARADLAVIQLLHIPQEQHLPMLVGKLAQGGADGVPVSLRSAVS